MSMRLARVMMIAAATSLVAFGQGRGMRGGGGAPAYNGGGRGEGRGDGGSRGIFAGSGNPGGNLGPAPFSGGGIGIGTINSGFGSVVFPGGVRSFGSAVNPVYSNNSSFANRLGVVVSGMPATIVAPRQNFIQGSYSYGYGGAAVYPYPVVVGGYGYQQSQPQVTVIQAPSQPVPVIINPNYTADAPARPEMRVYGQGAAGGVTTISVPAPSNPEGNPLKPGAIEVGDSTNGAAIQPNDEPAIYLIGLKDGTIYASYAYWVERDTLHYITPGHAHNQVSLDQIDVPLSRRLNRERKLDFNAR
jgi:hypothetical protein